MPHSHPFGKNEAGPWYDLLRPTRVTDVGPGAGMWHGALAHRHRAVWTAVEVWEPYVTRYGLNRKYDRVLIRDARDGLPSADLTILGDVLEHMEPDEADAVVADAREIGGATLISVPIVHYDQGPLEGNPYETHLWHPTHDDVMDRWAPIDEVLVGDVVGVYWTWPR